MKFGWAWLLAAWLLPGFASSAGATESPSKTHTARLEFSNPPQDRAGTAPVTVTFTRAGDSLLAHFKVTSAAIFAKPRLAHDEYPYDFDVVELFVRNGKSQEPTYYEFEVSPYDQALQVNVREPRQQYYFGVQNGFTHRAVIVPGGWEADMKIPLASLGWDGVGPIELVGNAYAALGEGADRIYWSLFELPPGKPDFHVPAAFKPLPIDHSYSR